MVRLIGRKRSSRGFSLIELMIVVAIIGVLSTVGIPTFTRMVAKSKQTEAKTNLGGLYTAEAAFFAEYGGYGNNLVGTGFTEQGSNLLYTIGFPNGSCVDPINGTIANIVPWSTDASGIGAAINTAYPNYYSATASGLAGRPGGAGSCSAGTLADPGANYTATGTGCVTAGCTNTAAVAAATTCSSGTPCQDVWTITDGRIIVNVLSGIY